MFADLMHFDNLRRNIREFEAIIEINFATDGQAVLGKSSLLISLAAARECLLFPYANVKK